MQLSPAIRPTVLLVEADSALRRLIALGLRQRGIEVIEASSLSDLPPATRQPHLLLLDIDSRGKSELSALALIAPHMGRYLSTLPVIVLAWEDEVNAQDELVAPFPVTYLPKPFDARTLHATIQHILAQSEATQTSPAHVYELSPHAARPTMSIWPLLTAAGLFLAFIGLMGLLPLTGFGLLIVFASLLWWTLGSKTERAALPAA